MNRKLMLESIMDVCGSTFLIGMGIFGILQIYPNIISLYIQQGFFFIWVACFLITTPLACTYKYWSKNSTNNTLPINSNEDSKA
jgi:hypothetical protein